MNDVPDPREMIDPQKKDGSLALSLLSFWNRSIGREGPATKTTEPNGMGLKGSAVDSGFHSLGSAMFIGRSKKTVPTSFGGAEFN